jgi:protein-tyrosine-phosphatase
MENQVMFKVIFACVHNAGRSQMSAAFFNQLAAPGKARAISAGTHPGTQVHPVVIDAMREVGIDLSSAKPQKLTQELAADSQLLITMGCGDECPYVPGLERDDWPLPDPKGQDITVVRKTRDEIASRVRNLILSRKIALSGDGE